MSVQVLDAVLSVMDICCMVTLPWLLTGGGPMNSTEFYAIHLYRNAFSYLRMGKASALAWILFFIIVFFTLILFKTSARWVYYGGEE